MKKIKFKIILPIIIFILITSIIYYFYNYPLPWKRDFEKNWDKYIDIINILKNDEYNNLQSFWWEGSIIQFKDSLDDYWKNDKIEYEDKYKYLLKKVSYIRWNTYFLICPNWIIKISKWWWLNHIFETVYLYSENWFAELPNRTKEKLNNNFITYFNYDSTYSASNLCNVK